ncbi:DNA-binding response regulator [Grimontia hollisae]|uniref:DNA-binding response regulator KdpE n=1 Tax=Grimontia hollisae CIP 101886 TaxID=675812 RepID=D0I673_GRIHO|nr:response regulator transcription factor [Grimontia hollisae]AMG31659.1 DNA-binding response regulator [Grimontia hollisae]EEY72142.1 DNA-binding response regulator KdpE [Grimontia hollisae CIP 101886]STO45135.1 KDP operon transcriptional regulatory protein KdpE [Grimontia hollisae]
MKYNVLVIDDEPQIHTFIRISLTAEGFEYVGANSVRSALKVIHDAEPDVIVLDLGLPDGDGIDVLNNVRASSKTPILILTARDQEDEKIRLLEAGANDYLSKPFGVRELIARIKVLVRDLVNTDTLSDILEYNRLKINKSTHQAWIDGEEVSLTKKEFAFIEKLMAPPGRLVKQSELLTTIWGQSHENDTHYLRILVSQLRKKLHDSADEQNIIKTESGVGYRLV